MIELAVVIVYLLVGCVTVGFIDLHCRDSETTFFWFTMLCWPIVYAVFILIVIFMTPIKFGRRLGKKVPQLVRGYSQQTF